MSELTDLYDSYEQEVLDLLPVLLDWWNRIEFTVIGRSHRAQRWPLGLSGHPSFIAVFRRYALQLMEINARAQDELDHQAPDSVEWGVEAEKMALPIYTPRQFLIDQFIERHQELRDHFRLFMYIPLGFDDYNDIYGVK